MPSTSCLAIGCKFCSDDDSSHCYACSDSSSLLIEQQGMMTCVGLKDNCRSFDDQKGYCTQCKLQFKHVDTAQGRYCLLDQQSTLTYFGGAFSLFIGLVISIIVYLCIKSKPKKERLRRSREASLKKDTQINRFQRSHTHAEGKDIQNHFKNIAEGQEINHLKNDGMVDPSPAFKKTFIMTHLLEAIQMSGDHNEQNDEKKEDNSNNLFLKKPGDMNLQFLT